MVVSAILLIRSNPMHQSIWLTSANAVSSTVYDWSNSISGYLNLRENNEDLNRRNAELQAEVERLRLQVQALGDQLMIDSLSMPEPLRQYDFIVAHVIKNSVARPHNYITINRGSEDGIGPEMGVIDQNGVVGVVNVVGPHSARIISLLNPNFRLSCKVNGSDAFGSLVWDGEDPRYAILEELPRHSVYHPGDTIVTSGYSAVFPPGIPVGVIEKNVKKGNAETADIKVRLLSDFSTLNNVQVVVNYLADEIKALENNEEKEQ